MDAIMSMPPVVYVAIIVIISLVFIGVILAKLYVKASKEVSFVRTGAGGAKVISSGGAFVIKIFHDIVWVNMKTLKLVVVRHGQDALITKDKLRVNVQAEFYLRVKIDNKAIETAAQTLGDKTLNPNLLKELVEGKFVDALRSVAAGMEMNELHEKRSDFVQSVQETLESDLTKNGLELESVSLTGLDQTPKDYFDENNAFDAQGLTKITETVEENKKRRNNLEQDAAVKIAQRNLEAQQEQLKIKKQEEEAGLNKEREVEILKAVQEAEIAKQQAEQKRLAEVARITSEKQIAQAQIAKEKDILEHKIAQEKILEQARIEKQKVIQESKIEQEKTVQLSEQGKEIAIAQKSEEQSKAKAKADEERAKAVVAEENVITAREKEQAERKKSVELIQAAEEAEKEALGITVKAKAEREASELESQAIKILAEADAKKFEVEAKGKEEINAASNILSVEQIELQFKIALIKAMPDIIAASVKPLEQIDSIKIIDFQGGNTVAGADASSFSQENGNLSQQAVNAALRYKVQLPVLQSLLAELGMDSATLEGMTQSLSTASKSPISNDIPDEAGT